MTMTDHFCSWKEESKQKCSGQNLVQGRGFWGCYNHCDSI